MDQVTAQALTLFEKLAGIEGNVLNGPTCAGTRQTNSVYITAKLVPLEELANNSAARKATVPPVSTDMVGSE
jgi:hypothetical protein